MKGRRHNPGALALRAFAGFVALEGKLALAATRRGDDQFQAFFFDTFEDMRQLLFNVLLLHIKMSGQLLRSSGFFFQTIDQCFTLHGASPV